MDGHYAWETLDEMTEDELRAEWAELVAYSEAREEAIQERMKRK